jgi:hypothetical protein
MGILGVYMSVIAGNMVSQLSGANRLRAHEGNVALCRNSDIC